MRPSYVGAAYFDCARWQAGAGGRFYMKCNREAPLKNWREEAEAAPWPCIYARCGCAHCRAHQLIRLMSNLSRRPSCHHPSLYRGEICRPCLSSIDVIELCGNIDTATATKPSQSKSASSPTHEVALRHWLVTPRHKRR